MNTAPTISPKRRARDLVRRAAKVRAEALEWRYLGHLHVACAKLQAALRDLEQARAIFRAVAS